MVTAEKMKLTNRSKIHALLTYRRNIVADDHVLDHSNSLVIEQANNRTYAAQWVLKQLLKMDKLKLSKLVEMLLKIESCTFGFS